MTDRRSLSQKESRNTSHSRALPGKLLILGGWAHGASRLRPLTDALRNFSPQILLSSDFARTNPAAFNPDFVVAYSAGSLWALDQIVNRLWAPRHLFIVAGFPTFVRSAVFSGGAPRDETVALSERVRRSKKTAVRAFWRAHDLGVPYDHEGETLELDDLLEPLQYLLQTDFTTVLSQSSIPVSSTLVVGENDKLVPREGAECFQRLLRSCELHELEDVGHGSVLRSDRMLQLLVKKYEEYVSSIAF